MHPVVLDTNVLIAGLWSNRGASHRLLRLVGDPRWTLNVSVPLALEYQQTLQRLRGRLRMSESDVDDVLDFLFSVAALRPVYFRWRPLLPDPKDDMVLEVAVACRAEYVVSFNAKDFAGAEQFGIAVVSPARFLAIMGEKP